MLRRIGVRASGKSGAEVLAFDGDVAGQAAKPVDRPPPSVNSARAAARRRRDHRHPAPDRPPRHGNAKARGNRLGRHARAAREPSMPGSEFTSHAVARRPPSPVRDWSARSARAVWARSIEPATRGSIAPSRSSVAADLAADPSSVTASTAKPARSRSSRTRTSARFMTSATHDGTRFLVMELLEGETLADRLRSGPFAREALRLACEIADALDAPIATASSIATSSRATSCSPGRGRAPPPCRTATIAGFRCWRACRPMPLFRKLSRTVTATHQPEQSSGRCTTSRPNSSRASRTTRGWTSSPSAPSSRDDRGQRIRRRKSEHRLRAGSHKGAAPAVRRSLCRTYRRRSSGWFRMSLAKDPDDRWSSMHDVLLQLRAIAEYRTARWAATASPRSRWGWLPRPLPASRR